MSGRPRAAGRDYDRAETAVDGVVHVVGLVLGVTGAAVPIGFAARKPGARDLPVSIVYVSGLLAMLGFFGGLQSLAGVTHQMAAAPLRSLGDLSADAATYTPFTVQMRSGLASGLLVGIWTAAAVGIVLKLVLPGRFDRLSLVLYLLLGWRCDAVRCDHLAAVLDHMAAGRGRRALLAGRRLPPMGEPALPERDLALFRSTRRCLPLPCGVRIPWRDDLNAGRGAISSRLSVQPEPGLAGPSHCRVAGSRS